MKIVPLIAFAFLTVLHTHAQLLTPFEKGNGNTTTTYTELISFYQELDKSYKTIQMEEAGATDANYPLHVVYYSGDKKFDIEEWRKQDKLIIFINNGIHPGEPDGIDASMMLLRDAAVGKISIPDNIILAVVPIFNVGGMLNRNSHSRANQNGPEAYGFRGSARNLDLNRDFMKTDAKETQTLIKLFHRLDPDIFIDNHVSNGADYQHVMTLLSTQHNKLGGKMGEYLNKQLEPMIYEDMKKRGYDLVPYVNHWGHTPDKGWTAFHEGPRFASGFAALFQTYSFVPETHMLKPFKDRVKATYVLMQSITDIAAAHADDIRSTRMKDRKKWMKQATIPVEWIADTTAPTMTTFKGYEGGFKPSEVSGLPRLYYDRNKPYTKQVPILNTYTAKQSVTVPAAYVIPHGWRKAVNKLKMNGVKVKKLENDTLIQVASYYVEDHQTNNRPYEGHYLHTNVKVRPELQVIKFLKGDYIVPTNQKAIRYIIEALEPTSPDAYFAWGFFDAILQQKEHFSDYVWEDEAANILRQNPELRKTFEAKRNSDATFAKDGAAQLDFIYRNSAYYEEGHMRYPVFRIER